MIIQKSTIWWGKPMRVSYDKLWKLLIDKKMNRTELKMISGISSNVVAKMGRNEFVSMESLAKICVALQCNVGDLVDILIDEINIPKEDK